MRACIVVLWVMAVGCGGQHAAGTCELGQEGGACTSAGDCCSNLCDFGVCGAVGSCTANDLSCSDDAECCSGACQDGTCAAAICQALGASCASSNGCCSGNCDGGVCADGSQCLAIEEACTLDAECCSDRCQDGVCLPSGSCLAPGADCQAGPTNECCSARCEPVEGQSGVTRCVDFCRGDGATCDQATDCCGLDCNGGVCGGSLCKVESDDCRDDGECCSNICGGDGKCELDPANTTCRGIGETCNSGPQMGCCSMVCDETQDPPRCGFGADTCKAQGATCAVDADCCHGACDSTTKICVTVCVMDGSDCTSNADCCSSVCGDDGTCSPPPNCEPLGDACATDTDCCSGLCLGGLCDQIL